MYQALKDSLFLFIPLAASLILSLILFYLYYKDRNQRKLVFAVGLFVSAFGFYNPLIESFGYTPIFPSGEWLFMPLSLAVATAALSSLLKIEDFRGALGIFLVGTFLSLVAYFGSFSLTSLRVALSLFFMSVSVPVLTYTFMKSRASADLNFLIATLCFLFQGVVLDLGSSVDIPVLLALFGAIFIGFMFNRPKTENPSNLPSFILLEKKLDEANQNLKIMEAKLLKAERLAAIGELAGLIGHDLRNPLQGIMGATHYLRAHSSPQVDAACLEMLDEIDDCIRRSDKIINDLVDYSAALNLQYSPIEPYTLTQNSLKLVEVPARITVLNEASAKPTLQVDCDKLERTFTSIIKNSFDAMPEGGKLVIKAKKAHDKVVFSFQDTGVGMSEEALGRLWTPLFTTKAKGMGFGLANCKRIVEAHGGSITAESTPGEGTLITVTLPVKPKQVN
jgi:signal transduction histidine kinase